jgi:hypothetical protein
LWPIAPRAREDRHAKERKGQQHKLALQLIACLGRDSAIHVCKVNGWAGILDAILSEDPEDAEAAE